METDKVKSKIFSDVYKLVHEHTMTKLDAMLFRYNLNDERFNNSLTMRRTISEQLEMLFLKKLFEEDDTIFQQIQNVRHDCLTVLKSVQND